MTLQTREMHLNATKLGVISEGDWQDAAAQSRGELFRDLQEDHGRPETMYLDIPRPDAAHSPYPAVPVDLRREHDDVPGGWVFTRTESYVDDPTDTWRHEVWVEVREKPETTADADRDMEAG
jgi:hypothetical protein